MIYTVTFNPAVDYVMHPLTLDMGFTNRSSSEEVRCGGNGINVSSILNELNVDTICLGIIAGFTGDYILDTLQSAGVTCNFVRLDKGFTRINAKVKAVEETEAPAENPVDVFADASAEDLIGAPIASDETPELVAETTNEKE